MQIKIDISVLRETKWSDYAIRFLFGGIVTAAAGLIAKKFGPGVGGLFLSAARKNKTPRKQNQKLADWRVAQRLLSRFRSQGFIHHDLSRACLAQATDSIPRVILLGPVEQRKAGHRARLKKAS